MKTIEVPIQGMDCAECTRHVQKAISGLTGVQSVEVFLASEKAVVQLDPALVELPAIQAAVESAGYAVRNPDPSKGRERPGAASFTRPLLIVLGVLFAVVLFAVIAGEWLGLFERINQWIPWYVGVGLVVLAGYPVFVNVARAALRRQVIAHTLMTVGIVAAMVVGEWITALMVVLFMRVGDFVESFTAERARGALKDLEAMAPQMARVERAGSETEVPAGQVQVGEIVIVRPGEVIAVDGIVLSGQATLNQAAITGEAMPVEVGSGGQVYAASLAQLGSLRVRATQVGSETTFGRIIRLVEHAEANKAPVERVADRFSAYFLPVVTGIAALTFLISRDPLATAAVLVVACSCAFALATPVAMLASIGAGARHGLLIKGGKYLEVLARADVLLIDKTGTLTLGKPQITDIVTASGPATCLAAGAMPGADQLSLLQTAATAERYSEHPLAEAVRLAARQHGLVIGDVQDFAAQPGIGVRARVDGRLVEVGNGVTLTPAVKDQVEEAIARFAAQGKSVLQVRIDGELVGALAAADTLRAEVPEAVRALRRLGLERIELLTGDHEQSAASLANQLGIPFQARMLPQDKIRVVREYQAAGRVVVMVGDGVNDAPALAQADVGIAMGAAGSGAAMEAAHIALMSEDWGLVPDVIRIAQRTMGVVKMNIGFTAVYNLIGLTLAAFGILPPVLAAAAQSLPDLGILANSSRLIRQKR